MISRHHHSAQADMHDRRNFERIYFEGGVRVCFELFKELARRCDAEDQHSELLADWADRDPALYRLVRDQFCSGRDFPPSVRVVGE